MLGYRSLIISNLATDLLYWFLIPYLEPANTVFDFASSLKKNEFVTVFELLPQGVDNVTVV